jgi:deoxyribodipyrimidine photolyase
MLEMQIEQLQTRKILLAEAKGGKSAILKELAEKVKLENIEEIQKQATLKRQYKHELPNIEQAYRNKLKEIGTKCNECESNMLVLAQEIGEVIDYIDSFTADEKNRIKKLGTHIILSMAKVNL